ncbi:putative immunoglobulin-blocking virulence protein [Mycoplasma sp. E35C]|uniref:putative immunoglobulin-blocking virulence protein n=1 Tax=Mycoplasma sp. E35C TaxID=2801918 RepID=UPI001CA3F73C|nr:putative immunoglobulin-blocking virulence protein [Mycoplasma sp. E35C]QZX49132.1 putative immunoglobulin-blocking virulence protein [Mycoplasma sp. E35C]
MLSSKKRKLIKIISLSTSAIAAGGVVTTGVIYSQRIGSEQASLVNRSDKNIELKQLENTGSQYDSNRDFNTENIPKQPKPDFRPVVDRPEQPNQEEPRPQFEPDLPPLDPTIELSPEVAPETVVYQSSDYGLDADTPVLPYDPNAQTISGDKLSAVISASRSKLNTLKNIFKGGNIQSLNTEANKQVLLKLTGYKNPEHFNDYWEFLFKERNEDGRTKYPIEELINDLNRITEQDIIDSAKTNRYLKLDPPNTTITWGFQSDDENPYYQYYKKSNEKRLLSTSDYHANKSPEEILKGNFKGWKKTDVTKEFIGNKEYGITADDGITVRQYTPEDPSLPLYKDRKPVNYFVLDVINTSGYDKFIEFVKKAAKTSDDVGVVLENIGKNTTRDVYDILKSLPTNVKSLTLFIDNADTRSLLGLEDKHIKELNIYTSAGGNSVVGGLWGINPLAIKHINFIPSLDAYNVRDFAPGTKVASTPIFSALRFDRNDDYKRVQEGIDIAFNRRTERIFQGNHQGKGGKPVVWDFSNAPIIRSFKGLNLRDAELQVVRLSTDLITKDESGSRVVYDLSEFNNSQWTKAMSYQPERGKFINFGKSGDQPPTLIIKGTIQEAKLSQSGLRDLQTFIKYAIKGGSFRQGIYVEDDKLIGSLSSSQVAQGVSVKKLGKKAAETEKPNIFEIDNRFNAIGEPKKGSKISS